MAVFDLVKTGVCLLIPGSTELILFRMEVKKPAVEGSGRRSDCFICCCKILRCPETNSNCLKEGFTYKTHLDCQSINSFKGAEEMHGLMHKIVSQIEIKLWYSVLSFQLWYFCWKLFFMLGCMMICFLQVDKLLEAGADILAPVTLQEGQKKAVGTAVDFAYYKYYQVWLKYWKILCSLHPFVYRVHCVLMICLVSSSEILTGNLLSLHICHEMPFICFWTLII